MERYLITGFSGFVGYYFVKYLNEASLDNDIEVLGIDIQPPVDFRNWNFKNLKISFKNINMLDSEALSNAIVDFSPTKILHLAALSSVGKSWIEPALCFKNNTEIFLNIVETLRLNNIDCKLLCIGSSEEYGFVSTKDIPIVEDMRINPSNPYAVTKVAQESLAKCYVDKYNMKIMMTRSFNHIGPRQRDTFVIASFTKQIAEAVVSGKKAFVMKTGNLSVVRDFLDVRDVVKAYYLILQKGNPGELYNVCSGNGYQLRDIINSIGKISGCEVTTEVNPDFIRPNDMPIIIGDNSKISKHTGWKPEFNITQSLTDIFSYWVEQLKK